MTISMAMRGYNMAGVRAGEPNFLVHSRVDEPARPTVGLLSRDMKWGYDTE